MYVLPKSFRSDQKKLFLMFFDCYDSPQLLLGTSTSFDDLGERFVKGSYFLFKFKVPTYVKLIHILYCMESNYLVLLNYNHKPIILRSTGGLWIKTTSRYWINQRSFTWIGLDFWHDMFFINLYNRNFDLSPPSH